MTPATPEHQTADWIAAAAKGDQTAFDRLCGEDRLQRWAVMIGARLPQRLRAKIDPEDILQDTLQRAWRDIGTLKDRSPAGFHRWVVGIARHVTTDHIRRFSQHKRDTAREEGFERRDDSAVYGTMTTPSMSMARREQASQVVELLDQLSAKHRDVLILRVLEGYTTSEVADMLDTSVANVSVMLHRGLVQIRDLMDEMGVVSSIFRP